MSQAPLGLSLLALVVAAIAVDLLVGDPSRLPHPVVGMGRVIARLERAWNHGSAVARRARGILLTAVVVLGVYALAWGLLALLGRLDPWLAMAAELWLLATTLAIKGLRDAARAVASPLGRGDLPGARRALAMIVGRDTAALDEGEISRGAVETVAENTVDGITAPLFWALLGGAPLALAYKAVNTLDSMVGYRNARHADFGWASARLDDLANWLPARLTALALWLGARGLPGHWRHRGALAATRREAPRHPSPNAGWPEAMVARLLGVQLGGVNHYGGEPSRRALLGEPLEALGAAHIGRAVRLMHGGWSAFLLLMLPAVLVREWLA
ncbi:adenosylcobinamide-phosphate synthase CbiB [Halomonas kalidii]|uniref:Cobalamin biosynthesis protein CobD n=1 Tax=Halomonas kalidii TaxID=3043293 RepID=A0ABT6VQZ1_9GAMM|nr:adenosylcobinamide-phosphate synthase CbiB [Halomonas kalidii]MDI5936040.1 adenosylcobinamide-phosphate synthase CbiB [Halomonas kalidii]